ncbi:cyclase family protein [Pseudohongiella spirulinae]|uniref:Cyclase family protein n=1 Tax=Pseudohongiella spirulinae TaxID=1249552 RepID=A0A0S2KHT6_9GAMM|nr:cyclase family protein [Pseudohongiella spirulinae]ALO47535.1 Cyclase family protein [Pseudohongiella spirulinae]
MKIVPVVLFFVFACSSVVAQDWVPSQFGADDRIGAANHLSPELVLQAAGLITTGKVYSLGIETAEDSPAYGTRTFDMQIIASGTQVPVGADVVTSNDERVTTSFGIGSQIDGLGHLGIGNQYYNGLTAAEIVRPDGLAELGTHTIPPIVTRGVLLDMTRHYGVDMVPEGTAFNRAEIQAVAQAQGVQLQQGDVVLFHTGWMQLLGRDNERFISSQPGPGVEGAEYLADLGVVAIGADTPALEVIPFENPQRVFAVHQTLLAKKGVYILESMNTAELAADGVQEFMFVLGQPKFKGAVQVVINPIAIR